MTFDEYLVEKHAQQYTGVDDDMPDDYISWLDNLDQGELISYADAWGKKVFDDGKICAYKENIELIKKLVAELERK